MGGFLSTAGDVLEKVFQESNIGASISQWLLPTLSTIEHTPTGKVMGGILRNQFEPEVAKTASFYRRSLRYTPQEATLFAMKDTTENQFGMRGEGLVNFLKAVYNESGSAVHANNVADGMDMYFGERGVSYQNWRTRAIKEGVPLSSISSKYIRPTPGGLEQKFKELASWIFLPRIVIPHATQPLNVLLYDGAQAFGKATADMFSGGIDAAKRRVIQSGVLEDQILYNMIDTMKGGGLARKLFHMPGFNYMRELQITHSALAGEYAVRDAFSEYVANGRQLTPNLNLVFQRHGIDPAALRGLNDLTPEMIQTAQYRAGQSTYFIRSGLDTPYPWGQNKLARFAMMYKHFSFNQGRFVIKALKDSYNTSPEEFLKTLGILATLYPMAGFAVGKIEDAISLRPGPQTAAEQEDFGAQYRDALLHAAGFGIAYSIFRSAKRNALADYAIGPIPSTVLDYTQDIINAPSSKARRQNLGRDFLRRVPLVGPALQETYMPTRRRRHR